MGGMTCTLFLATVLSQAAPEPRSLPPREPPPAARPAPENGKVPVTIEVKSDLRKLFRFVEARIFLDGNELTRITAPRGQELANNFRAFDAPLGTGRHSITVNLVYQGRNTGPFTYLDDYRYRLESTQEFTVEAGRPASVEILAHERPGATVPLEEKPTMSIRATVPAAATAPPAPIIE